MNPERLKKILTQVRQGELTADGALKSLKHLPYEDIDFARIDHHRSLRRGFPIDNGFGAAYLATLINRPLPTTD